MSLPISAEMELVLACARAQVGGERELRTGIRPNTAASFSRAFALARRHRLALVLIDRIKAAPGVVVPPEDGRAAMTYARTSAMRNLELTGELLRLLGLLERNDIEVLAYKGPVWSAQLYGSPGLREFSDLDLLVPPHQARAAIDLLAREGYRPWYRLSAPRFARYQGIAFEMGMYDGSRHRLVEIHWYLLKPGYSFSPRWEEPWKTAWTVALGGRTVRTLSPDTAVLFSCAHLAQHNWSKLGWLMELALMVKKNALDWDAVIRAAGSFGSGRMIRISLLLADEFFSLLLPNHIRAWIAQDTAAVSICRRLYDHLLSEKNPGEAPPLDWPLRASIESSVDRAFYWYQKVLCPTPADWEVCGLPDWLYAGYYFVRAGRLLAKHTVGRFSDLCRQVRLKHVV